MRTTTALWKSVGVLAYLLISSTQPARAATGLSPFDDGVSTDFSDLAPSTTTGTEPEPPRVTLKPHLPPGHQGGKVSNLHPVDKGHHYYTPDGAVMHPDVPSLFARANVTYQRPAVVLPHSSLVRYTRCLLDGIRVGFESQEAYDYAETHWPVYLDAPHLTPRGNAEGFAGTLMDKNNETGFLLISESLHCDASESGLHSYWHVSKLDFDDEAKTVSATAVEVGVDGAFDDVSLAWGSTHSDDDKDALKQGRFSSGSLGASSSAGDDSTGRPGSMSRRQQEDKSRAVVLPWYSNIPQANLTTVQWNTVQATPQYYITPPTGTTWSAADRFTVLTLRSNTTSNTTGSLVYGYGGASANQIQPQPHYALTSFSRELAPGYSLPQMQSGSCGVRLITYVFKEPAAGINNTARSNSRDAFNVVKYATDAGLGQFIASHVLTVMNGPAAPSCTAPVTTAPTPATITSTIYTAPISTTVTLDTKPLATGCANPPATYKGLLTSACGVNFDQSLDYRLGYLDFQADPIAAQKAWAPSLQPELRRRGSPSWGNQHSSRSQHRRGWNPISWVKKAVKKVVNVLKNAAVSTVNTLTKLVKEAETKVNDLTKIVLNTLNQQISQSFSEAFDIALPVGGPKRPEWKDKTAFTLFQNKDRPAEAIYCVDCGVDGNAIMSGAIAFRVLPPTLSTANVKINGNLHAGVGLGLTGNSTFTQGITKRVVTKPVPKAYIKIADLFTGGLVLTVDAVAEIQLETSGQVIVGKSPSTSRMDLYMDRFVATLDLVGGNTGASGDKPRVEKRFEVNGPLTVALSLAAPVQFGLELEVPPLKWERKAGIRNTPKLTGTGVYQDPSCDGIKYDLDFEDRFDAEHFGKVTKLVSWEVNDITTGCYVPSGWVKPKTTATLPPTSTVATATSLPTGAGIKVAPSSPNAAREFYEWALFPGWSFAGMMPTLRGPFTTIEACAQRCLEEKDGCVAVSRYGDQCSLYYTDRPNGSKLQLVVTTADNAGMYLGTCEDVQAALPSYREGLAKCQRFFPDVQTSPDSPQKDGEISKSWCAVTGASLPQSGWTMDGGLQTGKDLKDCWSQCLVWGWDCRAVGFNPTTGNCQFSLGSRGSVASLEVLAAKNMSRTLVNVPCEKLTLSGDQACKSPGYPQSRQTPGRKPDPKLITPYRYFPGSRDHLAVSSDSPLQYGLFEASEFFATVIDSNRNEISAGGFVNADTLSKCTSGCLSNAACQAVTWGRAKQADRPICRFYKAVDGNTRIITGNMYFAMTVVMGRCENVAGYLDPAARQTVQRCTRYYPITNRPQGTLKRRADTGAFGANMAELQLPGPIMDTPEITAALDQAVPNTTAADEADRLISLVDLTGAFALAPAKDGSLYLSYAGQAATYKFAALENAMVYGDGVSSAFWFYPDTMATLGISRLRFGDFAKIPKSSQQITLVSVDADANARTPGTYVASSASGQTYFLAICSIDNRQAKVFLVRDPVAGLAQLQAPESQYTVTGGPTSGCVMAVLQSPGFAGL